MDSPQVSIVIVSHNEGRKLRDTVQAIAARTPAAVPAELIIVDDASSDGSTTFLDGLQAVGPHPVRLLRTERVGIPAARNIGAGASAGRTLIFMDAHSAPAEGWLGAIRDTLEVDAVGIATLGVLPLGTERVRGGGWGMSVDERLKVSWLPKPSGAPCPVPVSCGCCMAFNRSSFHDIGPFDEAFGIWGFEDIEISLRAWLLGKSVLVSPTGTVLHRFKRRFHYKVAAEDVERNRLRVFLLHFSPDRLQRALAARASSPNFASALAETAVSDVWAFRERYLRLRTRDDDWFFGRFAAAPGHSRQADESTAPLRY